MPKRLLTYATVVAGIGALLLLAAAGSWDGQDAAKFGAYLLLACAASTLKARIPGMGGTFSPGFVALLVAGADMGWQQTALIAAASALMQCYWHAGQRPGALQVAFNTGSMVIAASAAVLLSHDLVSAGAPQATVARLAIAAVTMFGLNSALVSVALGLFQSRSVLQVWRECHLWTFVHYVVGALIAFGLLAAAAASGLTAAWLGLPIAYMQHMHYREFVRRAA